MQSLVVDKGTLPAGQYLLVLDAAWNLVSSFGMDYRNIAIDIYSPRPVSIEACSQEQGIKQLVRGIKYYALQNGKKDYFLKEPEVADAIFRVKQIYAFNNWFGFLYIRNNSTRVLTQTYDFKTKDIDVIHPESKSKRH